MHRLLQTFVVAALLTALTSCDARVRLLSGGRIGFDVLFVLESIEPSTGRHEVGPATEVTLRCSVSVDRDASPARPVRVTRQSDGTRISGSVRFEDGEPRVGEAPEDARDRVIVWKPDAPLAPGPTYHIDLDPDLVSVDGQRLGVVVRTEDGTSIPAAVETFANPPSSVTGLAAGAATSASVALSWRASRDDVTSTEDLVYELFVAPSPEDFDLDQPAERTRPGQLSALVVRLDPDTAYRFAARAVDEAGNRGALSAAVVASTEPIVDITPPNFSGIDVLEAISPTEIRATWSDAQDDVDPPELLRYHVYVAVDSGGQTFDGACLDAPESLCRVSPPGANELVVDDVAPDSTLFVVVRAVDTSGNESSNLEELEATTLISFEDQILPLLTHPTRGCTLSTNCHRGATPRAGLNLESYAGVIAGGNSQRDGTRPPLVVPGEEISDDMQSFFLWRTDETNVNFEGPRMPLGRAPWPSASLNLFKRWVRQGALDN